MKNIPIIKKKVNAFLVGEEGKISKESIMKVGLILGASAIGTAIAAKKADAGATHINNLTFNNKMTQVEIGHTHHASHSSHASHASHGQW